MHFCSYASRSTLTALALVAGTFALPACDATIEGGGSGGSGGGEESSASGVAEGGATSESSVSTSSGPQPGASTAIALFAHEIPAIGGGDTTVSGGSDSGAGGAEETSVAVVAVGVGAGGWDTGVGGAPSGEGGYGSAVGVGGAPSGEGGYGSAVGVGGAPSGEGGYGSAVGVGGAPQGEGGHASSGVGGGPHGGSEDDRLFLFISDDVLVCADPFGVDDACGPRQFRAAIGLPVEYQRVGLYSLNDPAIVSHFSVWEGGDDECMGGGGSFFDGTIEVLSIDDGLVRVRLAGTSPADVDGDHDVVRCSGAEPPGETSVLAYFPSALPQGGGDTTSTVGTGAGEDVFVIDFADHAQSCPDPYADQPGPGERHENFSIQLPQSYLAPGTYSLSDPAITTIYTQMEESTAAVGGGFGGEPGTLTIFEVTAGYVDLQLEGSQHAFANGGGQVERCN